jgi:hypothetical protein
LRLDAQHISTGPRYWQQPYQHIAIYQDAVTWIMGVGYPGSGFAHPRSVVASSATNMPLMCLGLNDMKKSARIVTTG